MSSRDRPGVTTPIMGNLIPFQYNSQTTLSVTIPADDQDVTWQVLLEVRRDLGHYGLHNGAIPAGKRDVTNLSGCPAGRPRVRAAPPRRC